MANIKKLQEAMDLLLNEEDEAADVALHEYFVGLARKINEEFQDAELEEAEVDFDDEDDVVSDMEEIDQEEGVIEDDDFGGDNDMDMDMDMDDDMDDDTVEVPQDELEDLRSSFDALAAKFEEIVGGDDDFEDDDMDFDMDDDDMDDDMDELGFDDGDMDDLNMDNDEEKFESVEEDGDDELDETLREYTEKVAAPQNAEGKEVGTGPSAAVNKQSITKPKGNLESGNAKPHPSTGGEAKGYAAPKKGNVGELKGTADNKVKGKAKSSQAKVSAPANKEGGEVGNGGNRGVDKHQLLKKRGK